MVGVGLHHPRLESEGIVGDCVEGDGFVVVGQICVLRESCSIVCDGPGQAALLPGSSIPTTSSCTDVDKQEPVFCIGEGHEDDAVELLVIEVRRLRFDGLLQSKV